MRLRWRLEALAGALAAAVDPDLVISPPTADIGFVHRRCADADIYFIANTGPQHRAFRITARGSWPGYEEWDAASGEVRACRDGSATGSTVTLHPLPSNGNHHDRPTDRRASQNRSDRPEPSRCESADSDGQQLAGRIRR